MTSLGKQIVGSFSTFFAHISVITLSRFSFNNNPIHRVRFYQYLVEYLAHSHRNKKIIFLPIEPIA